MNNIIERVWHQNKMVKIEDLRGMAFQAEAAGHTFQISGVDKDGNALALSGTVSGVFLRPDNTDVAITGAASGGVVSVTLPAECYDVPGRFGLTVYVSASGEKVAVYAAMGTVSRASSGTVSPGTVGDVVDLINRINAAVQTIPASWSGLMADIAPDYSDTAVYPAGAYVWYDGDLYRSTTAITTAETFNTAHWVKAVLGNDFNDLNSAIGDAMTTVDCDWYEGGLDFEDGGVFATTKRIRTSIIKNYAETVVPTIGYAVAVLAYSTDDTTDSYVGAWDGTQWVKDITSPTAYSISPISLSNLRNTYGYYFRLAAKRTDDADLTISDGENVKILVWTDKTLSELNKVADAGAVGMVFDQSLKTMSDLRLFNIGSIDLKTGENASSTTRIRMYKKQPISDVYKITALNGYEIMMYCYTSDGEYLGVWTGSSIDKADVHWKTEIIAHIIDSTATMFRIVVRHSDDSAVTTNDYLGCLLTYYKNATVDENRNSILNIMTTFSDEYVVFHTENGIDGMAKGAIDSSGADASSHYNNNSFRSIGFMELYGATTLISEVEQTTKTTYYHFVLFYDDSFAFISRVGGEKFASVIANVPNGAKYFRVSLTQIKTAAMETDNISSYVCRWAIENRAGASPQNKWYVLGDSISAGYYSMTESMAEAEGVTMTYISPVTTESGEVTGSVWDKTLAHNYWGYANKWHLKRELVGKAHPGQGYFRNSSNDQNGVYVVSHNDFSDAGLITVAWGFNDWHYNQPRGNHDLIDPAVPYPGENYDTTQITTVNQAIWFCLGELIRQAPKAKIIVQTPMNGWAYGGDWATNWGIGYEMSKSGKLSDIHDDIVYWANYYGLQILDMTYNNSIVNRRNIKDTLIDGSHPSDAAHQQLGRTVAIALKYC